MNTLRLGGPYRYTREGRGVFHLPLARPWTWALTHHGMWSLFVTDVEPARQGVPARRHPLHPPEALLGCWLAVYATREYDAEAVGWLRKAHGLEAPAGDVLPAGCYVAVARLAEVSTVGNDSRYFRGDAWWAPPGAPFSRGTIAWRLEEVTVVEPLPAAPAQRLAPVDVELLPELRERVRLSRDGLWRPEVYPVPAALPLLSPAREEPPAPAPPPGPAWVVDDTPVPPMLHVEQLGLFGDTAPVERPAPPAPPVPFQEACAEATPSQAPRAPSEDLHAAADRVRALLADGAEHSMAEVMEAAGADSAGASLFYRVTMLPSRDRAPLPWEVVIQLRGTRGGNVWYAAWPGGGAL